MITIQSLISDPLFKEFKLVAGHKGIYNQITGTGIFDWEGPEDVENTFKRGEFVLTTLLIAKDDKKSAEKCIKILLRNNVSGIGIKTIYYKELSDEIIRLANSCSIPVFLFNTTYIDDLIYVIKKKLANSDLDQLNSDTVYHLINNDNTPDAVESMAKSINPFIYDCIICSYCSPAGKDSDMCRTLLGNFHTSYEINFNRHAIDPDCETLSVIQMKSGILIIHSFLSDKDVDNSAENSEDSFFIRASVLLDTLGLSENFYIGTSNMHFRCCELDAAIKESLFANVTCRIDNEKRLRFSDLGADKFLIPVKDNSWIIQAYKDKLDTILQYDSTHNSNMLETLIAYIESGGSINLTGSKMFQHENTIRYRINKIKNLLGINESEDSYVQMFIIVRLHKIFEACDNLIN